MWNPLVSNPHDKACRRANQALVFMVIIGIFRSSKEKQPDIFPSRVSSRHDAAVYVGCD